MTARLQRASGQTMYLAETPERRFGTLSTPVFLERLAASLDAPPYAAVLGRRPDGSQFLVVAQVLSGRTADSGSVEYRLQVRDDDLDIGLEVDAERLMALTEPLDLQLTYVVFTGIEGCSLFDTACTDQ